MSTNKIEYKETLRKKDVNELKQAVIKEAWIALTNYFNGAQNEKEAKISIGVLTIRSREMQSENNSRALDLMEVKLGIRDKSQIKVLPQ